MKYNFNFIIKRTNRKKTLSIVIKDQKVFILVPKLVTDFEIEKLLNSKINWIEKKLSVEKNNLKINKKFYKQGEIFQYLGNNYILKIEKRNYLSVDISEEYLIIRTPNYNQPLKIKEEIKSWYINRAIRKIKITHNYYESLMKLSAKKLIFGEYKSKWGSCNSKKVISYDWRIIMSPTSVINYLVVHEISHILHPNHSKNFWLHVEKYIKEYKSEKKWLRLNSKKLIL